MASPVPAKSQPLHNFSLPHLKWKNHRSGRSRLTGETSSSSPPHRSPSTPPFRQSSPSYVPRRPSPLHKQSPMRESESESEPSSAAPIGKPNRKTVFPESTKSVDNSKGNRSNKIYIRFRNNATEENHSVDNAVPSPAAEDEESSPKTWNLRPRRPPINHKQSNAGLPKIGSSPLPENRTKESSQVKHNDYGNMMTSKKHKFSISLSREEIEEDIFSITGFKPNRRPKKRPKTVQKKLDTLFPGLWLGTITADSYKVSEAHLKG